MKKTEIMIAAAFIAGVIVGATRPIKKFLSPVVNTDSGTIVNIHHSVLKFIMSRKERIEDLIAEAKIRKHRDKAMITVVATENEQQKMIAGVDKERAWERSNTR